MAACTPQGILNILCQHLQANPVQNSISLVLLTDSKIGGKV
jgi:hypothetical protein